MRVTVHITRRPEISDPEGSTVLRALQDLGYGEVSRVRFNREISLDFDGGDVTTVTERVREMCNRLLANPVIEDYRIEVET